MAHRLLTDDVWPTITSLAKSSSDAAVAVAYLGRGACKRLPLPPGSVLVVDASDAVVEGGMTSPEEIEQYLSGEVNVFTSTGLHAKVFVFDQVAVVGSANVSHRSARHLVEAAILTDETTVVENCRDLVLRLAEHPLTAADAQRLQDIYRPLILDDGESDEEQDSAVVEPHTSVETTIEWESPYQEMLGLIRSKTGLPPCEEVRDVGDHGCIMYAGGSERLLMLKYARWSTGKGAWVFGLAEKHLWRLAQAASGFICLGLLDQTGTWIEHVVFLPAASVAKWYDEGQLGNPQKRGTAVEVKLNVYVRQYRYFLGRRRGPTIDQYVDAYEAMTG